jgi:hypothetical protein
MKVPTEIIVIFFLISFLIYTMPSLLVQFNTTIKGKFLLLTLTVIMTIYNRTAGLLMAMLMIFLFEFKYEFNNDILYEGFATPEDNTKEYDIIGNNPMNRDKKKDQLAIEQALMPTNGNVDVMTDIIVNDNANITAD